MAVSIHMHGGVLQNLVVVPEERDGRQTGRLEVVAGETRRLGLCALRDGAQQSDRQNIAPVPQVASTRLPEHHPPTTSPRQSLITDRRPCGESYHFRSQCAAAVAAPMPVSERTCCAGNPDRS
jgi:hypothetical protein